MCQVLAKGNNQRHGYRSDSKTCICCCMRIYWKGQRFCLGQWNHWNYFTPTFVLSNQGNYQSSISALDQHAKTFRIASHCQMLVRPASCVAAHETFSLLDWSFIWTIMNSTIPETFSYYLSKYTNRHPRLQPLIFPASFPCKGLICPESILNAALLCQWHVS